MHAWQPIETAPKDGTVVLVWSKGDCHLASYIADAAPGWMQKDASFTLSGDMGPPTHWTPLPLPPREAAQGSDPAHSDADGPEPQQSRPNPGTHAADGSGFDAPRGSGRPFAAADAEEQV